jgi:hypothetical protein
MKTETVEIRVRPEEKTAFKEAARIAGVSFSTWARLNLRRAAMREFEDAGRRVDFDPKRELTDAGH